jgi:hypothetical protein
MLQQQQQTQPQQQTLVVQMPCRNTERGEAWLRGYMPRLSTYRHGLAPKVGLTTASIIDDLMTTHQDRCSTDNTAMTRPVQTRGSRKHELLLQSHARPNSLQAVDGQQSCCQLTVDGQQSCCPHTRKPQDAKLIPRCKTLMCLEHSPQQEVRPQHASDCSTAADRPQHRERESGTWTVVQSKRSAGVNVLSAPGGARQVASALHATYSARWPAQIL